MGSYQYHEYLAESTLTYKQVMKARKQDANSRKKTQGAGENPKDAGRKPSRSSKS